MSSHSAEVESLDLRVPTATLLAEVVLADGEALRGSFFVPAPGPGSISVAWPPGLPGAEGRLNDEQDFFPFLVSGERDPILLSKRQVAWVTLDARGKPAPANAAPEPGHETRVQVDCCGRRLEGVLLIDLPDEKSRVLDYLNKDARFLQLRNGSWLHYVSRDRITRVIEVRST